MKIVFNCTVLVLCVSHFEVFNVVDMIVNDIKANEVVRKADSNGTGICRM